MKTRMLVVMFLIANLFADSLAVKSEAQTNPEILVELSPHAEESADIRQGIQDFEFASFFLTAQNEDIELTSITFTRSGTSQEDHIRNLRLFIGHDQFGGSLTFFDRDKAVFSDFSLFIPSGVTWPIFVRADVSEIASGTVVVSINDASDVLAVSNGIEVNAAGNFPVIGNTMNIVENAAVLFTHKSYMPFAARLSCFGW